MAWCRVSSLTAAVSRSLGPAKFPLSRSKVIQTVSGKTVEGWELEYFLTKALRKRNYRTLAEVLYDLRAWLEAQG